MPIRLLQILSIALLVTIAAAPHARGADDKEKDKAPKNLVTIKDRKYNPPTLTIRAGETVTWVNKDDHDHTVEGQVEKDEEFDSGNLGSGDSFKHTFDKTGKFKYSCSYHPRMKGTIVVVAQD